MAAKVDTIEDDSFIILGTSPGTSLDMKCGDSSADDKLDPSHLEDALKDLSDEANMAFKAHFKIGDCPSPASMMVASTIVTDVSSTEELQKRFGELLDENVILKETLKHNNDSMKEQFQLIATCQEDMMKTQTLHKEKFQETKDLVEKLRQENKKLKQELSRKTDVEVQTSADLTDSKSGPSSGLEFVTSPDDDTINKLTAQLELIERQRRQVLTENEKLTWQKESLEHIIDATSKERDELRAKVQKVELQLSTQESNAAQKINRLEEIVRDLQTKLMLNTPANNPAVVKQLEDKVASLQADCRAAQLKILELENVKLEFTKHRSGLSEMVKIYKEQIQELHNRLKDAQTTMFQPVRLSLDTEAETSSSSEYSSLASNVRLYDRTLKHLAELMNTLTNGLSDRLIQTLGAVSSLYDYKLEKCSVEQFKTGLAELKRELEKQHSDSLNYIVQVKSTLSIFEGIFKDYNDLLKRTLTKQETPPPSPNVEALTTALLARGQEIQNLQLEVHTLKESKEDTELLKAQLDLYKSDFEAERASREEMACQKDTIMTDLRTAQRRIKELNSQLDEVRRLDPNLFLTAVTKRNPQPSAPAAPRPAAASNGRGLNSPASPSSGTNNTGRNANGAVKKQIYTCPKCMRFKTDDYSVLEDHLDYCLDVDNDPCSPM